MLHRIFQPKGKHYHQRAGFLKKLVHDIISHYDRITIEDVQIVNLTQNPHLAKGILDAGWGYFRRQLFSKAEYAGGTVVAVPPATRPRRAPDAGRTLRH